MARSVNTQQKWIEIGYTIFSQEGPEGLQVERLARILDLNKSGFYHYFGDLDSFIDQLFDYHVLKAQEIALQFRNAARLDPDLFYILIAFKPSILFHMQLVRNRHIKKFLDLYKTVNAMVDPEIMRLFSDFIDLRNHHELVASFYDLSRDMFYARITEENMNELFLRNLLGEVRELAQNFIKQRPNLKVH
ncbi:MAG: TetR/AcrR family transcriptional regulator [Cyclobacteriaceae bacterium]|nr:TetR/AcrR family transcriptional regulator [Cyclobacteriaceae bacterium]MBX2956874.1 TetR/AcrR family transcriptional regulator [Cyclobacteriaceae bacterium]